MPEYVAQTITDNFDTVARTGQLVKAMLELPTPAGEIINDEHTYIPVKNEDGKILSYMLLAIDMTERVRSQKTAEKIQAYQENEANKLSNTLKEGLGQGIFQFSFKPNPHDGDTAAVSAIYKQIGETLEYVVAFVNDYSMEIDSVLSALASGDLTAAITREYVGDFISSRYHSFTKPFI